MKKSPIILPTKQVGFTLIEVLVAMLIFAMLALSGWQIMDSLTKSRDRAKIQIDQLSQLQYAYLQLSQDFAQVSNYVVVPHGLSNQNSLSNSSDIAILPTFQLSNNQLNFIRFASLDPRFDPSPTLAKISYLVQDDKLIKQRDYQLAMDKNSQPMTSILLDNVTDIKWTVWSATPQTEQVSQFPDAKTLAFVNQKKQQSQNSSQNSNQSLSQTNQSQTSQTQTQNNQTNTQTIANLDLTPYQQLPKGVILSFTYHEQPIVWQFALPATPPSFVKKMNDTKNTSTTTQTTAQTTTQTTQTTQTNQTTGTN